jgi:hypothetical protein
MARIGLAEQSETLLSIFVSSGGQAWNVHRSVQRLLLAFQLIYEQLIFLPEIRIDSTDLRNVQNLNCEKYINWPRNRELPART